MATEYKITQNGTIKGTTHLFLIVEFYVDNQLSHTESFELGYAKEDRTWTGKRDADGEAVDTIIDPDTGDEIPDPAFYVFAPRDIASEVEQLIKAWEFDKRNTILTGPASDGADHSKITDKTDPYDFLAKTDSLVGIKKDVSLIA